MVVVEEEEVMGDKSEDGCLFILIPALAINADRWLVFPG